MKTNIYVLCGGKSVEHDISLRSASAIINAIDRNKYNVYPIYITNDGCWCNIGIWEDKIQSPDELRRETNLNIPDSISEFLKLINTNEKNLVIPALHGTNGEDGTVQGFLEMLDIPYVGNEVLSSSVAMDKAVTKDLLSTFNIPQVDYTVARIHTWKENPDKVLNHIEETIGYPCYVKPSNGGSSVGINKASNYDELVSAMKEAFLYDVKVLIEKEAVAREMQISVVGNNDPKASLPGEFIMERSFFDYNAKYIDGKLIPVIPARLTDEVTQLVRDTAEKVFKILNCRGLARVDIFVTDDNQIYVNEVNTMPGFTSVSMTPVLWGATDGTTYPQLIERLIDLALERYQEKKAIINKR